MEYCEFTMETKLWLQQILKGDKLSIINWGVDLESSNHSSYQIAAAAAAAVNDSIVAHLQYYCFTICT